MVEEGQKREQRKGGEEGKENKLVNNKGKGREKENESKMEVNRKKWK